MAIWKSGQLQELHQSVAWGLPLGEPVAVSQLVDHDVRGCLGAQVQAPQPEEC